MRSSSHFQVYLIPLVHICSPLSPTEGIPINFLRSFDGSHSVLHGCWTGADWATIDVGCLIAPFVSMLMRIDDFLMNPALVFCQRALMSRVNFS